MNDIFQEVDKALAEDKAAALWRKARPFVYGGMAALIIGVAGFELKKWLDARQTESRAQAFESALDKFRDGDLAGAKPEMAKVAEGKDGFARLASHFLAQSELELSADRNAAAAALGKAAAGNDALALTAKLKVAYLKADAATLPELETLVADLVAAGGAYGGLARELVAAKAAAVGDITRARSEYQALTLMLDAPRGVQQRAQQALAILPATPAMPAAPAAEATPSAPDASTGPAQ